MRFYTGLFTVVEMTMNVTSLFFVMVGKTIVSF